MNIFEIIRKQQIEDQLAKTRQKAKDIELALQATSKRNAEEIRHLQRIAYVKQKTEQILEESGALQDLRDLNASLRGKHEIFISANEYGASFVLVWGHYKINEYGGSAFAECKDGGGYRTISVGAYLENEGIFVHGGAGKGFEDVSADEWRENPSLITELIAKYFRTAEPYTPSEYEPPLNW